jgi:protein tyrosine/serine phosphatase
MMTSEANQGIPMPVSKCAAASGKRASFAVGGFLTVFIGLGLSLLCLQTQARGLPAQEGILNFGKVSDHLYRGAQPDSSGMASLKRLGVKLIVNLRMPGDSWKQEAAEAGANGIVYTNFPMGGMSRPSQEQVRQILGLFESCADPIFVHCQHGCDRTGTIVACYRIQHDHWTNDVALKEAKKYGISRFEFFMRRFVMAFNRATKPDLRQARAY